MAKRAHIRDVEEQAALYALGALHSDEAGSFQKRLSAGCPLCCALFEECRDVVDALPLAAPDRAPSPEVRDRLMARIGAAGIESKPKAGIGSLVRPGDTPWENAPMPGVEIRPLLGKKTMLVRMAPGAHLPPHEHRFAEQCLVLEGSVRSDDMVAKAGDFTFMPAGTMHSQLYSESGCLLLIAYT